MDDHGWGDAGGPVEGRANAGENAPSGVAPKETAANVVPFPRDWIGPLEDLVPIDTGTRPDEQSNDGVGPAAATDGAPGFWDGDISEARSARAPAWDERAPAATGVPPEPEAGSAAGGSRRLGQATRSDPRRPRTTSSTRSIVSGPSGRGRGLALSAVVLLLLAAVAAVLVFTGGLSRSTREPTSASTGPLVTTLTETVTTSGVTHRPDRPRSTAGQASNANDTPAGQRAGSKAAETSSHNSGATDGTSTGSRTGSVGGRGTSGVGTGDGGPSGEGESGGGAAAVGSGSASAPVTAETPGSSTGAAGSTCAQSPNSGCLP